MSRSITLSALSLIAVTLVLAPALSAGDAPRLLQQGGIQVGGPVVGVPVDVNLADLPLVEPWKPGDPIREIPRRGTAGERPAPLGDGNLDPLVGIQNDYRGPGPAITELLNYDGNSSTANPNDPTGDIGLNYFIEAINGPGGSSVTVYDKNDGSLDAGPFAMDTLSPGGVCTSGIGDPIVIFDHLAERWVLTEFSGSGNGMCVYTSRTADPISRRLVRLRLPGFVLPRLPEVRRVAGRLPRHLQPGRRRAERLRLRPRQHAQPGRHELPDGAHDPEVRGPQPARSTGSRP